MILYRLNHYKRMLNVSQAVKEINRRSTELAKKQRMVIIGITGGSASGKGWLAKRLKGKHMDMDSYYIGLSKMKRKNYDRPGAVDVKLFKKHLDMLHRGKSIMKPIYSFKNSERIGYKKFMPNHILIVEGLFVLRDGIRGSFDIKVFVDSPMKVRLARRIKRDIKERGRTRESVIKQFMEQTEPAFKRFVLPDKKYADIVVRN